MYVGSLEYAVADAVASLTRLRILKDGPFYLPRPRSGLGFEIIPQGNVDRAHILATSPTWEDTTLRLELARSNNDWLAWGDFTIKYSKSAPHPSLAGKTITKSIAPSFVTSVLGLPMRYRVRPRVIR